MKTAIIILCLLLTGITAQAQQALQKYYTALQALEGQSDSKESESRGKALAVFYDERVKEAGIETAKNETAKLLRQYIDYDFHAAFGFVMKIKSLDDAKMFMQNYMSNEERALIKVMATHVVSNSNTTNKVAFPANIPQLGKGTKGSWQNSGIAVALKDPNSNLASASTGPTTKTSTENGTDDFQKGAALYQAKNYTEAFPLLKKASEKGQPKAMVALATMYVVGLGVTENKSEAFNWYKKAAEKGEAGAMYMLGSMYLDGIGTTQNKTEAKNWLQKSADKGEEKAKEKLKTLQSQTAIADNGKTEYSKGDAAYNKKQYTEAIEWFQKAADKGNQLAMFSLGAMYFDGEGVSRNYSLAKKWIKKSMEKGNLPVAEQLTANVILDTIEQLE